LFKRWRIYNGKKNKSNNIRLKDLEKVYRFQCPKCGEWDYAFLDNDDPEAGSQLPCPEGQSL